jgi:hypothetical protein
MVENKKVSKVEKLLDAIEACGSTGMHAKDFTKFVKSTFSLYRHGDQPGLIEVFCHKNGEGAWVRNDVKHLGRPFKVARSYKLVADGEGLWRCEKRTDSEQVKFLADEREFRAMQRECDRKWLASIDP